jgi:hypothetical protein
MNHSNKLILNKGDRIILKEILFFQREVHNFCNLFVILLTIPKLVESMVLGTIFGTCKVMTIEKQSFHFVQNNP